MRLPGWSSTLGYWLVLLAYTIVIYWFSSLTSDEIPSAFGAVWDKLLHGASFGLLTFLFLLAVNRGFRHPVRPWLMVVAVLFALSYGLFDEWHQSRVVTRVASVSDLLADGLGSLAALPVYCGLARFMGRDADS
jgi:VanZ family protein